MAAFSAGQLAGGLGCVRKLMYWRHSSCGLAAVGCAVPGPRVGREGGPERPPPSCTGAAACPLLVSAAACALDPCPAGPWCPPGPENAPASAAAPMITAAAA